MIAALLAAATTEQVNRPRRRTSSATGVAFVFAVSSQGDYGEHAVFRDALERCLALGEATPALRGFAVQHALAQLWRSWGAIPEAVVGIGIGAHVAACDAGALDLDEAVRRAVAADGPELATASYWAPGSQREAVAIDAAIAALIGAGIDTFI